MLICCVIWFRDVPTHSGNFPKLRSVLILNGNSEFPCYYVSWKHSNMTVDRHRRIDSNTGIRSLPLRFCWQIVMLMEKYVERSNEIVFWVYVFGKRVFQSPFPRAKVKCNRQNSDRDPNENRSIISASLTSWNRVLSFCDTAPIRHTRSQLQWCRWR